MSRRPGWVADVVITVVWFLVVGVVVAVGWWKLVDLPKATRTAQGVVIPADQLGLQVGMDGWFFTLAAVTGLLSGLVLLSWRRRDPLLMVVLVTLGGGLAAYVGLKLGHHLGPGSEIDALRSKPSGATAPMQLQVHATGIRYALPVTAALGALAQLFVLRRPDKEPPPTVADHPLYQPPERAGS